MIFWSPLFLTYVWYGAAMELARDPWWWVES